MSDIDMHTGRAADRRMNHAAAPVLGLVAYLGAVALNFALSAGEPAEQTVVQWAVTFAITAVGVAVAVAATRRAMNRGAGSAARTALVLGLVALVSMVAFWTGFPCVFGAAAVGLGMQGRQEAGHVSGQGAAGVVLGALALVLGAVGMIVA